MNEFKNKFTFESKKKVEVISQDGFAVSSQNVIQPKAIKKYLKNLKLGFKMAKALNDLIECYPGKDEQYLIITEKRFNAFAVVLHILETKIIDELWFAIYRINEPTVAALISFIEAGKIKKGGFIVSNFFSNSKKYEVWAEKLIAYCNAVENFDCSFVHNHAKVLCLKETDNYYVFEGSGNMSDNARIEQYRFENSKETYQFHKDWMNQVIIKMKEYERKKANS